MSDHGASASLPSRRRVLLHVLLIVAGWALFGLLWWMVFQTSWAARDLLLLVVVALVLFPLVTVSWVAHNRALYKRLGPRRGVRHVALDYPADFNGRRIESDWATLQQAPEVQIHIEGDVKRFAVRAGA